MSKNTLIIIKLIWIGKFQKIFVDKKSPVYIMSTVV